MKVVKETDDELVLFTRHWLLSLGLIAFTLIFIYAGMTRLPENPQQSLLIILGSLIVGTVLLIAFARSTELTFDRLSGTVKKQRRSLLGAREEVFDLDDLSHAKTQKIISPERRKTGARIALVFYKGPKEGTHLVTRAYVGGKGPSRAVDKINAWLERTEAKA